MFGGRGQREISFCLQSVRQKTGRDAEQIQTLLLLLLNAKVIRKQEAAECLHTFHVSLMD